MIIYDFRKFTLLDSQFIENKKLHIPIIETWSLLIRGSLVQAHPEAQRATLERVLRVLFSIIPMIQQYQDKFSVLA